LLRSITKTTLIALPLLAASTTLAAPLHKFDSPTLAPNGTHLATLETDETTGRNTQPQQHLLIRTPANPTATPVQVRLPCNNCRISSPTWNTDGTRLAFIIHDPKQKSRLVYSVGATGGGLTKLLTFDGTLQALTYGPDDQLAVLATAGAHKEPGALQAGAPQTGEIGTNEDVQRIATIAQGVIQWQSPADLYIYEYDWRPHQPTPAFVATGAHGNGDEHWWVAKLYSIQNGTAAALFSPPQQEQLGLPHVSPDGKQVAFIGGLMSDFGFFGGDAYTLALDTPHATPRNLTPSLHATINSLSWNCGPGLTATGLSGAKSTLWSLDGTTPKELWATEDHITGTGYGLGLACGTTTTAAIRQNYTTAPELWAGPIGHWTQLTHANTTQPTFAKAQNITWKSDAFDVQGWLLTPLDADKTKKRPMIVSVHGGPSSANAPRYLLPDALNTALLKAGYDVFLPNPRGSYGQGEAFTRANIRDFGHGDLRDILRGIDAAEKIASIDDHRLGLTGYSYGGYMTMWIVTQTNRFRAAVAGGGIANWQSYYGENGIDAWMPPFFGATVYDDPEIYARSSPMTYIKQVKTPTFIFVGSADEECPPPQSEEFYHALHTLGVPTSLVIYPGEGHAMRNNPAHMADASRRTVAWFDKYLTP